MAFPRNCGQSEKLLQQRQEDWHGFEEKEVHSFKVETVNLITGSDQSVAEVARDLEIHPNTLYK
uniref:transposase n=1 Tax=Geothermobacter ehrlichii TaxID=213224 RepID=UPI0038B384B8